MSPGPEESALNRRDRRLGRILRDEKVGGLLVLAASLVALTWANSPWRDAYHRVISASIGPQVIGLDLPVRVWASDFLLAFFFFLVGLELKHEFRSGSLSHLRVAALPVVAAVGGMVVPALFYLTLTSGDPIAQKGWGIPMATDIAFALAVLAVAGRGLPREIRAFLLTLAVVDDIGAITIIAVFYSESLSLVHFAGAILMILIYWLLQHSQVHGGAALISCYLPLCAGAWWLFQQSGIHSTVVGVALGFCTRSTRSPDETRSPSEVAEFHLRPFVGGIVIPLFALTAAGVTILPNSVTEPDHLGATSANVLWAVSLALVLGKPIGIFGASWLATRFVPASLGPVLTHRDIASIGLVGGVGFTVSLLISELSFEQTPGLWVCATAGVLVGSTISAVLAAISLRLRPHVSSHQQLW